MGGDLGVARGESGGESVVGGRRSWLPDAGCYEKDYESF